MFIIHIIYAGLHPGFTDTLLLTEQRKILKRMCYAGSASACKCCSLYAVGVSPVNFLKTVLKVVFELKPASKPIERMVKLILFGFNNKRCASSTR